MYTYLHQYTHTEGGEAEEDPLAALFVETLLLPLPAAASPDGPVWSHNHSNVSKLYSI